jgi:hypothetical protein
VVIGPADEFWRLRLTRMDASDELDFEWHDDILWRQPQIHLEPGEPAFLIEAVSLGTGPEQVVRLAVFPDESSARAFLDEAIDDLRDMTRSQFELTHFPEQLSQ